MPPPERFGWEGEHRPAGSGEVTTQGGEDQAVARAPGDPFAAAAQDPHFVARGFPAEIEHPELGRSFTYPGAPYRFTATPWSARRAPLLGEHQADLP